MSHGHVLLAGNMGYVGPAVVRHLRGTLPEARLTGVDLGFFAHCLTGTETLPERRLDVQHFADVRNCPPEFLHGVSGVVNLAAISNDPMGKSFGAVTHEVNHRAAVRLARLAKASGARSYVFASSCSVYGFAEGRPRREDDTLGPLTDYAKSKVAAEQELAQLADDDFVVTCLRFPTACGMSDRLRLDLVLNDFVASALARGSVQILSDGTPWRPLIDTNDMALAIEWALRRESDVGGSFLAVNVGRDNINYQIIDLARAVADVVPGVEVNVNENAAPDKRSYQVDFTLYQELAPDHLPRYSINDSIRALVEGLRRMTFDDPDFQNSALIRLKTLTRLRELNLLDADLRWTSAR